MKRPESAAVPMSKHSHRDFKAIEAAWTPAETFDSQELFSSESPAILDDRNEIEEGDRAVLIVEDDLRFARILLDLTRAKDSGTRRYYRQYGAGTGEQYIPAAITLDIQAPGSRWLDRFGSPEARLAHQTYPGPYHHRRRTSPGGP